MSHRDARAMAAVGGTVALARDLFGPIQLADQVVFWHAARQGDISRRTAALAAAGSGAIVVLDLRRRVRSR